MERYTFTGQTPPAQTFTFPLGQLVKNNILNMLSPAFNKAMIVKGGPYPQDIDVIVIPKVDKFQYWFDNPSVTTGKILAKISIQISVYDMKGMLVWKGSISSPVVPEKTYPAYSGEEFFKATGSVAAESVIGVLGEAAKAMTSSREIHAFVSSKEVPETIASITAPKEFSIIKSDVDEPPAILIKPDKNAYAIVIGIEQYRQQLPKADFAAHDAKIISAYLTKMMGYPEENVITLINDRALKSDMEKYFGRWLSNNVEKNGRVFIYYSGHGTPDPKTGGAYLVPYDGDPSFIAETGYSLKRMYDALGKLPAKEIIVALDSCFSGAGGRSVLAKGARPLVMNLQSDTVLSRNMTVLSASAGDQISSTYDDKGHGLFTYFLLKGVKGEADLNEDGKIEVEELYSYLKPQVQKIARKLYNNEQSPQLIAPNKNKEIIIR
ncbi:MAG: caspase family protein [Proteobacteria bacterium]|nr:caspase family protein [Pseudomonadota bacterium]